MADFQVTRSALCSSLFSRRRKKRCIITENYQHVLAMDFAVKEINQSPNLLPNVTMGFNIYDGGWNARWTNYAIMEFILSWDKIVPNYKCGIQDTLLAVIENPIFYLLNEVQNVFGIFKIPQVMYSTASVEIKDTNPFSVYQRDPNRNYQHRGIIQLLQHFKWKWIGFFAASDEILEWLRKKMLAEFSINSICFAVLLSFGSVPYDAHKGGYMKNIAEISEKIMNTKANVLVFYGGTFPIIPFRWWLNDKLNRAVPKSKGKVWILTAGMELKNIIYKKSWDTQDFHGAMSFAVHFNDLTGFHQFLQKRNPPSTYGDGFIKEFWTQAFGCIFQNYPGGDVSGDICTGEENLENLPEHIFPMSITGQSYSIYNAVYALAHALHAMFSSRYRNKAKVKADRKEPQNQVVWELHLFLESVSFNNSAGEKVCFNQNAELIGGFDIINWVTFPNNSFVGVKVGKIDPWAPPEEEFSINEDDIVWHSWFNQVQPHSVCNANCQPGYRMEKKEGEPPCCYDCIPCPKGFISDKEDLVDCFKCPDDQYADMDQISCIPKTITFLSYQGSLGISLAICALSFSFTVVLMIILFVKHHNTPIVKANNRKLTYTLLILLLLCFLCALLFIGQPNEITCLLRRTAFSIIFTMALSTIMAKTLTVVLAFMAIQPRSKIKKWIGKKLTNSIVLSCTMIQAGICFLWVTTSPAFPETDMHSLTKEIVLQCHESSPTIFFVVLGYMGFMAFATFSLAFLARRLPDTFNEAKCITFSMLLFCSVWMSFVPSYLSTKGTSVTAVEIFSILASSAGLLGSLFFPKCYIILWKPELNKKEFFLRRKH
nr:vomeronasal type-2 receptor 26-like [Anolis sagrei ordinatus]